MKSLLPMAFVLVSHLAMSAEASQVREFQLPDHGKLELAVPESWQADLRQPPNRLPPTLRLAPKTGQPFEILVTTVWSMNGKALQSDAASLRAGVEHTAEGVQPQAVEQHIQVKELRGSSGTGYYFAATDRAPNPGEYKYMVQGLLPVDNLLLSFTILSNDSNGSIAEQALTVLKQAVHRN